MYLSYRLSGRFTYNFTLWGEPFVQKSSTILHSCTTSLCSCFTIWYGHCNLQIVYIAVPVVLLWTASDCHCSILEYIWSSKFTKEPQAPVMHIQKGSSKMQRFVELFTSLHHGVYQTIYQQRYTYLNYNRGTQSLKNIL